MCMIHVLIGTIYTSQSAPERAQTSGKNSSGSIGRSVFEYFGIILCTI